MKKSYHTDLSIQFQLGLLDSEVCGYIPKSTLYSRKKRDFTKYFGNEFMYSEEKIEIIKVFLTNQTLLKAAKGLYFIYSTWLSMMSNVRGLKTLLRKNKESILEIINYVIPLLGLKHACKLFKISKNQYYAWKRDVYCSLAPLKECIKKNALNLSVSELQTVKAFVQNEQYKDYPLSAVYYEMLRKGKAFMSLTTFYKYAKSFDLGIIRKIFKAKQKTGIRASNPNELIHADVCVYRPLDNTKCFIYFICDNFSRMILGWRIALEYKSSVMLENLRTVYSRYYLEQEEPPTILFVDDGIENKGYVSEAIESREIKLTRLVAQKDISFSNSMIEAVNKRMKYDFLFRHELLDLEHTQRFLETAVELYNNRPHSSLSGFTPIEVFNGAKPDKFRF
jgi:transposase InsO family protein